MKKLTFLLFISSFLTLGTFANDCPVKFKGTSYCAELVWTKGPIVNETSAFTLTIFDESSMAPTSPPFEVAIYSWMIMHNGHSHGGPLFSFTEVSAGIFEVDDARFFMGGMQGYWEVRVDLREHNTLKSQATFNVPLK